MNGHPGARRSTGAGLAAKKAKIDVSAARSGRMMRDLCYPYRRGLNFAARTCDKGQVQTLDNRYIELDCIDKSTE